jgi:hypothetical protein
LIVCSEADEVLPRDADIEDLFAVRDYLRLYNWAFSASVTEDELPEGNDRILKRLVGVVGAFDHALPAHALTRNFAEFAQSIDEQSVSRFERLFVLLNATVSD